MIRHRQCRLLKHAQPSKWPSPLYIKLGNTWNIDLVFCTCFEYKLCPWTWDPVPTAWYNQDGKIADPTENKPVRLNWIRDLVFS